MQVEDDERCLMSKSQAIDEIAVPCVTQLKNFYFGEMTNGASNDIERATAIARAMVTLKRRTKNELRLAVPSCHGKIS